MVVEVASRGFQTWLWNLSLRFIFFYFFRFYCLYTDWKLFFRLYFFGIRISIDALCWQWPDKMSLWWCLFACICLNIALNLLILYQIVYVLNIVLNLGERGWRTWQYKLFTVQCSIYLNPHHLSRDANALRIILALSFPDFVLCFSKKGRLGEILRMLLVTSKIAESIKFKRGFKYWCNAYLI